MKKLIAGIIVAAQALWPVAAFSQTVGSGVSSTDMQALQLKGQALANAAQGQAPTFNADGSLSLNSTNSQAQTTGASKQSVAAQGAYLQKVMGIQGYQAVATPGRGDSAAAQVSATQGADFSCTGKLPVMKNVGSQYVVLNSCQGLTASVSGLSVSVCSAMAIGGVCDKVLHPESFTDYQITVGSWTTTSDGAIGASCNGVGLCRVTVQRSIMAGGAGSTLQSQANAQVAANGTNQFNSTARTLVAAKTADQQQTAVTARDCFLQNQDRMAQGLPALTCDGQQTAGITGTAPNSTTSTDSNSPSCSPDQKVCLRKATQTVSYSRSCTRTFPLTEYDCKWSVPNKSCTVTVNNAPAAGTGNATTSTTSANATTTSTCSDRDIAGAVKVGSTQGICDSQGKCNTTSWVDTYVFPDQAAQTGSCTVYPTVMAGSPATSCVNHGAGTLAGCADGSWVGRTLEDSQCYAAKTVTAADGTQSTSTYALTYAEKPGCGYCAQPIYSDTCYAQSTPASPSDSCGVIPAGCQLNSTTPLSSVSGLTTSQTESYTCTQQQTSCVQYQQQANCPVNLAQGTDHAPQTVSNMASFNQAMASAAVMAAIEKSAKDSGDPLMPKIFEGSDLRCRTPVGFLSGLLLNDCCKISLDRPGGNRPLHKCTDNEVKLAAARRANQTVFIGDYCSRSVGFWKAKKCVERTQTYCSFDGVLSRLIQAQGRDQLAKMVSSGFGSTQTAQINFPYYNGQGGWAQPTVVNDVTVVPFQYPAYCASPQAATTAMANDPSALPCPNVLTQWFATCSGNSCGELPLTPDLGSDRWLIQQVDPLKNGVTAIARTAAVAGACDPTTSQCAYKVTAWPAASGGKAVVTHDWAFNLYAPDTTSAADIFSLGDDLFRPHPIVGSADGKTMPGSLQMDYSLNYGGSWSTIALPTNTGASSFSIPGTDVTLTGSCDPASNACTYQASGTVTATLKPWGWAENPDCSGFTPAQIGVMDFSKMDLSEWIAQVMGKVQPPDSATLGQLATQQVNEFYNSRATGGTQTATSPTRSSFAHISPSEAMGPFNAQLYISAYWPVTGSNDARTDRISSVQVDWGDCTLSTMADYASRAGADGNVAEAFLASHTYVAPNRLACGAVEASVTHTVHLTVTAKSGVHYTDLSVVNQWNTLSGQTVGLGQVSSSTTQNSVTVPIPGQNVTQ